MRNVLFMRRDDIVPMSDEQIEKTVKERMSDLKDMLAKQQEKHNKPMEY